MQRHSHTLERIAHTCTLAILAAGIRHANAGTFSVGDGWPATNYPRHGLTHAIEATQAISNRYLAATLEFPYVVQSYRHQYSNLTNWKAAVATVVPHYIDWRYTNSAGNLETYFTNTVLQSTNFSGYGGWAGTTQMRYGPIYAPRLSITALVDLAGIPTNYFEYHPRKLFHGGPPTWTNATTANGGPLPAGRSEAWHTGDYGWHHVSNIIRHLSIAVVTNRCLPVYHRETDSDPRTNSIAAAYADHLTVYWPTSAWSSAGVYHYGSIATWHSNATGYRFTSERFRTWPELTMASYMTNFEHAVQCYRAFDTIVSGYPFERRPNANYNPTHLDPWAPPNGNRGKYTMVTNWPNQTNTHYAHAGDTNIYNISPVTNRWSSAPAPGEYGSNYWQNAADLFESPSAVIDLSDDWSDPFYQTYFHLESGWPDRRGFVIWLVMPDFKDYD